MLNINQNFIFNYTCIGKIRLEAFSKYDKKCN